MGVLPAEVRRKKAVPYCRMFFQSPDMESQVARCMASQFPSVLCQVRLIAGSKIRHVKQDLMISCQNQALEMAAFIAGLCMCLQQLQSA